MESIILTYKQKNMSGLILNVGLKYYNSYKREKKCNMIIWDSSLEIKIIIIFFFF